MPANLIPPQAAPHWTHTPQAVLDNVKAAIERTDKEYDSIASIPPSQCDFESVFTAIANAQAALSIECEPLIFYQNVSPSKELRDAANDAEVLLRNFAVETEMRLDLFQAATNAKSNIESTNRQLSPEQIRLVEKTILDGIRAGLALPEEERVKLKEVR
jgi:Zn-dependent oligopeptidase